LDLQKRQDSKKEYAQGDWKLLEEMAEREPESKIGAKDDETIEKLSTLHSPPSSTWTPGRVQVLPKDFTWSPGQGELGLFGRKPQPKCTWNAHGLHQEYQIESRDYTWNSRDSSYLVLGRTGWSPGTIPVSDMLLVTNCPCRVYMLSLVMFVTYFRLRYIFGILCIFFHDF